MEPNEELMPEIEEEAEARIPDPEAPEEPLPGGRYNLEICPNCLEPNDDDLAVCRYCGQPLNPNAEPADLSAMPEDEKTLEANRAAAVSEKKPAKKQENGFRRWMPWIGLYLIYYAVTGCFDMGRQIRAAQEAGEEVNAALAYLSQGIWFLAGTLMAWPLIKKGYRKLRHLPEEDEEPAEAAPAAETEVPDEETPAEEAEMTETEEFEAETDPEAEALQAEGPLSEPAAEDEMEADPAEDADDGTEA
ncbi:MAG: zinc ribbon domain-containing protein [Flexilinea sp.]|nr:zinc ribbon domain-containing protein [Flexilinea sp.]